MIVRLWLVLGTILVGLAWWLTVPLSPPAFQMSAASAIDDYRARGLVPEPGRMTMSDAIGHDVFEIPMTDARHAAEEAAVAGQGMPGMVMEGGEATTTADPAEPAMDMAEADEPATDMSEAPAGGESTEPEMDMVEVAEPAMDMSDAATTGAATEPAMDMAEAAEPATDMSDAATAGESTEPAMDMADEGMAGAEMEPGDDHADGFGLMVMDAHAAGMVDRTIEIEMADWSFQPARIMVSPGDRIRFVVRNAGDTPHEFMFMSAAGMAAVSYRLERADWNLVEHETIFERPVVMPGDSFEVVVGIESPGAWVFMCMFPFHMQMGMMGIMTTSTTAGAEDMGGMKM